MVEAQIAERISARHAELSALEEQLVKQLDQVRAERDELAVAERVWHRMAGQLADEQAVTLRFPRRWQAVQCCSSRTGKATWPRPCCRRNARRPLPSFKLSGGRFTVRL
ncbi:hypothetical protein ACWET9_45785 [Streptomyces sp. NPDC004059]